MAEITVNLIHDMKERHAHKKAKPPFITGLRTGYVRAWFFVVLKVWLVAALISGVNPMDRIEKNITLLDSLINNDFSHPEIFFDNSVQTDFVLQRVHYSKDKSVTINSVDLSTPRVAGDTTPVMADSFQPRGPEL